MDKKRKKRLCAGTGTGGGGVALSFNSLQLLTSGRGVVPEPLQLS